jgi:hypothetical protein
MQDETVTQTNLVNELRAVMAEQDEKCPLVWNASPLLVNTIATGATQVLKFSKPTRTNDEAILGFM